MDFNDSEDEAAYRQEVRTWLQANSTQHIKARADAPAPGSSAYISDVRGWQKRKAEAGYACIPLPKRWGGGGRAPIHQAIFREEEAAAGVDYGQIMSIAENMAPQTILAAGDDAMKARFVPQTIRGEMIWCQLFSEPSGGSDVAAVRTRAVRAGGNWIMNGQKIWTSYAQHCDFGLLLARTDPDAPKHKGLTMFILDMRSTGVERTSIRRITGDSNFNQIFFSDVHVSDANRLGEVNDGWRVALVTLMNERYFVGEPFGPEAIDLLQIASTLEGPSGPLSKDSALRAQIADWHIAFEGLRLTRLRAMTSLSRGEIPGPENSISKLIQGLQTQALTSCALELQGAFGLIDDPALSLGKGRFQEFLLHAAGRRIESGTDEIMRNIIAERVLGLPSDMRVDKDVAFKDLPFTQ